MGCCSSTDPASSALATGIETGMTQVVGSEDDISHIPGIPDVKQAYEFGRRLGVGGSCHVREGHLKADPSQRVAIKIISKELDRGQGDGRDAGRRLYKREVFMLHKLTADSSQAHAETNRSYNPHSHGSVGHDDEFPTIVPFVGHGEDGSDHKGSYYIVTRLLTGGEIINRLIRVSAVEQQKDHMSEKKAVNIVYQMLAAVKYCHNRQVVHRDIKPENFMFSTADPDASVVLIDFGCALEVEDAAIIKEEICGTVYFMAPEIAVTRLEHYKKESRKVPDGIGTTHKSMALTGSLLKASDVWSIGVIAYILITGHRPFRGRNNVDILNSIVQNKLLFPRNDGRFHNALDLNPQFIDFCVKVLVKDPSKRPTIDECLNHPWIQSSENSDHKNYRLNQDVIKFLKQFKQQTKLKKKVTRLLAQNMKEQSSQQHVKAHFERIDNDNDGFINHHEMKILMLDMGYSKSQASEQATKIMNSVDADGDGKISYDEFETKWYSKVLLKANDPIIQSIFDIFDTNGDGFIDGKELNDVLFDKEDREDGYEALKTGSDGSGDATNVKDLEMKSMDKQASIEADNEHEEKLRTQLTSSKTLINEVDENGDGKISFEEFRKAMKDDIANNGFDLRSLSHGDFVGQKHGNQYD